MGENCRDSPATSRLQPGNGATDPRDEGVWDETGGGEATIEAKTRTDHTRCEGETGGGREGNRRSKGRQRVSGHSETNVAG